MKLNTVSLTGADDSVDPSSLSQLAQEFPFVEFGILFSNGRQGTERYPSADWIVKLMDVCVQYHLDTGNHLKFAAHLCGEYAREFIKGNSDFWLTRWERESGLFKRIQLNVTDEAFMDINFLDLVVESQREGHSWDQVIVQTKRPFERATYISSANAALNGRVSLLYDASGGKGISPKSWPSIPAGVKVPCGYAGGINPQNVDQVLKEITKLPSGVYDSWIDMETGVRNDHGFSLDYCREVLQKSRQYVIR